MQALEHILATGKLARYRVLALLVSVVAVGSIALEVLPDWRNPDRGWEAYWVAQALAAGKGFAWSSAKRWLFDPIFDGGFHPTAWVDPFYTFCLAGIMRLFGDYHQLAAIIFNLGLLLAVFGLTYRLGERLISAQAGVMAVLALALIREFSRDAGMMNNTMLAATMVVLSALVLVKFLEGPSYRRAGALGLVLGLTALACPGAQLFILVTAAAVAVWGWRNLGPTIPQAILVFVVGMLTVLPWTVRNYLVFGEFVPVRTGTGQIAFVSVVATGGTVEQGTLRSQVKPPWSAVTPRSAVKRTIFQWGEKDRLALDRFQVDYAKDVGAAEYAAMNEAQRDAWFIKETKAYLAANPVLSAKLAITKVEVFIRTMGFFGTLVFLLGALGGLLAIRTPAALTLALWVGTYLGPFLLITCYFTRYRAPIEPLLVVLASFAAWRALEMRGKLRAERIKNL